MYYSAIDGKLTAFHSSKKIVNRYIKQYSKYHPESTCTLLKDVSIDNDISKLDEGCELVQVKKIYLQRKYEDAYLIYGCGNTSSISQAIKVLERELMYEKDYFKMLQINEGIRLLEMHKHNESHYVPSCREMDDIVASLLDWQYSVYYGG